MLGTGRDWVNTHPGVTAAVLAAGICVSLGMFAYKLGFAGTTDFEPRSWYLDTGSGELFRDRFTRVPPFEAPSGAEAVRVFRFRCAAESPAVVGYYEKYTPEVRDRLLAEPILHEFFEASFKSGRLWSRDGKRWVDSQSPEGKRMVEQRTQEMAKACGGTRPRADCCGD